MRNKWLIIVSASVVMGVALSFILRAPTRENGPYLPLDGQHRVAVTLPGSDDFGKVPLGNRIFGVDENLSNYLVGINALHGSHQSPLSINMKAPPKAITDLLNALPDALRALLSRKLVGIYLTANLTVSGLTQPVFPTLASETPYGGVIILNLESFETHAKSAGSLDTWMATREYAIFKPAKNTAIRARMSQTPDGLGAFEYELLRGLGMLLTIGSEHFFDWNANTLADGSESKYPFFALSWLIQHQLLLPLPAFDFKGRKDLAAGSGSTSKVAATHMREIYEGLEQTNFPTLYAALSPIDAFAESFASFIHTKVFHQTFEFDILVNGKKVKTVRSCWDEPRCATKRALLEKIIMGEI